MSAHVVASVGLVLDIAGAIFVVESVLSASDDELAQASDRVGVWGSANVPGAPQVFPRPALLKLVRDARRDARIGAVIGFVGQRVGVRTGGHAVIATRSVRFR